MSSTNCVAVGIGTPSPARSRSSSSGTGRPWATVTAPPRSRRTVPASLRACRAAAPPFCVAVGHTRRASLTATLVRAVERHRLGHRHESQRLRQRAGATNPWLASRASAPPSARRSAASTDGVNPERTLVAQWNGSTWASCHAPNVSPTAGRPASTGVDCFSRHDVQRGRPDARRQHRVLAPAGRSLERHHVVTRHRAEPAPSGTAQTDLAACPA